LNTFTKNTKTNGKTLCVNSDIVDIMLALNRGKAHVKTRNGKWIGLRNGAFIDKLGYIDLFDAITHVEMGNTIECVLYNISYDYSISFHYSFCFLFRLLFCSVF
jgi:hypothetical protein